MPDNSRTHTEVGSDHQKDYSRRFGRAHIAIQKIIVRFAAPAVVLLALFQVVVEPSWQAFVATATVVTVWGALWFAYKKSKAGRLEASGSIFTFSIIAGSTWVCSLLHDMAVPMILICVAAVIYSSMFSRRLLITAGIATVVAVSFREMIVDFAPAIMRPVAFWQEATAGIILTLIMFPLMSLILRNTQILDAKLIGQIKLLNEEQGGIIRTAGQVAEALDQSIHEIRELSATVASQAGDQSTAISQINAAMDQVRSIAGATAESATVSKLAAGELDTMATSSSLRLINLGKGFGSVVAGNETAQSEFNELARQAESIEDILRSNREIAAQIKILAVNAGIQAAKAGDYGDGFRVVANQLKALISRTEKSLSQSRGLLEDIRTRARQSSDTIRRSAELLEKQLDDLSATGLLIEEIMTNFKDSAHRVDEIQTAAETQQVELDQVATGVDYVESAAKELSDGTQRLISQIERMTVSQSKLKKTLLPMRGNRNG